MDKFYTANEIIERIKKGWKTRKELEALHDFIEKAEMSEEELKKLQYSGYLELVYEYY